MLFVEGNHFTDGTMCKNKQFEALTLRLTTIGPTDSLMAFYEYTLLSVREELLSLEAYVQTLTTNDPCLIFDLKL